MNAKERSIRFQSKQQTDSLSIAEEIIWNQITNTSLRNYYKSMN